MLGGDSSNGAMIQSPKEAGLNRSAHPVIGLGGMSENYCSLAVARRTYSIHTDHHDGLGNTLRPSLLEERTQWQPLPSKSYCQMILARGADPLGDQVIAWYGIRKRKMRSAIVCAHRALPGLRNESSAHATRLRGT